MTETLARLRESQGLLFGRFEGWLREGKLDQAELQELHRKAALAMHDHYCVTVPRYRQLAERLDLLDTRDPELVWSELSCTETWFKSYDLALLDHGDFARLTDWLESICSDRVGAEPRKAKTLSGWLAALAASDLRVRCSSGSSGRFSFVPRDVATDQWSTRLQLGYASTILTALGASWKDLDPYIFSFRGGGLAISAAGQELARITGRGTFLFDFDVDVELMRAFLTGKCPPELVGNLAEFRKRTIDEKASAYGRLAESLSRLRSTDRKALLLTTPYLLLELCRYLEARGEPLSLPAGSLVALGGGWKTFSGERIARDAFEALILSHLGVAPEAIVEAYSMVECNASMQRCRSGRFHVPPVIWPMVFGDDHQPIHAERATGRFAYSDPFAGNYPGFFVTGDEVTLVRDSCPCGATGPTIVGEISRAANAEARGCAGVMASVRG